MSIRRSWLTGTPIALTTPLVKDLYYRAPPHRAAHRPAGDDGARLHDPVGHPPPSPRWPDTIHATVAGHGAGSDPVTVHEVARDRRERASPAHHADTNADKLRRGGRSRRLSSPVKTLTVSALASAPRSQEVHTTWRLQFDNWGTRPTGRGATGMY